MMACYTDTRRVLADVSLRLQRDKCMVWFAEMTGSVSPAGRGDLDSRLHGNDELAGAAFVGGYPPHSFDRL